VRGTEQLCKDPSVDAVIVALPNDLHLPAITLAAENHKDLICEKPLARNMKEAEQALAVARRYGVIHCYAENQIFSPQFVRAGGLVRDGAIGKVTWIRSREAHSGPHSGWFWDVKRAGGGVMLDMGCHSIEATRYLFGKKNKPTSVSGWTATLVHKTKAEDNSLVVAKYAGGAIGHSENSWSARGGVDVRFEIFGSEGTIFIDNTRETGIRAFTIAPRNRTGYIVEKADAQEGWIFPAWREYITYGFLDELRHFVGCLSKGRTPSETFDDGLMVNSISDAAYRSARESKWIDL
jgi:predicted dehydrogenase